MISRRLLRIKILQILYAYFINQDKTIAKTEKELFFSIDKTFELYNYLLLLLIDLVNYAENKITIGKEKMIPTFENLNPNTKFVNNKLARQIIENDELNRFVERTNISWNNHPEIIKNIYLALIESPFFKKYLANTEDSYKIDKDLIIKIYKVIISNSEELYDAIEDMSIYWNDDIEFILDMVIKTFKNYKEENDSNYHLFDLYKDDEDINFTKNLFRKTILHHDENKELIDRYAKNWNIERIASIDTLIMELAIVEITEFSSVPINVSFNEYLEISKFYSTDKSSTFINGILDNIIKSLQKDDKIKKIGRGLTEGK